MNKMSMKRREVSETWQNAIGPGWFPIISPPKFETNLLSDLLKE